MLIAQPLQTEAAYFDDNLQVSDPQGKVQAILGTQLSDYVLTLVSGAFRGSDVTCLEDIDPTTSQTSGLRLVVRHPTYILQNCANQVVIKLDASRSLILYIDYILLESGHPAGLAALMLWRMVRGCELLGIDRIELLAYGGRNVPDLDPSTGERWGGYYAWPKMGFDGHVQASEMQLFPFFSHFPRAIVNEGRVRGLINMRGGAEWWKANGNSTPMFFDVGANEESVRILRNRVGG